MSERLNKCEQGLLDKEKDLAYVKFHLHETNEKVTKREKEIDVLKVKNIDIENEMNLTKESNQKLHGHVEMVLKSQNTTSRNKEEINRLKMERKLTKETLCIKDTEIQNLRIEVNELSNKLIESENNKSEICKSCESLTKIQQGLKNVGEQRSQADNSVKKSETHPTDRPLNKVNREKGLISNAVEPFEENTFNELHHEIINEVNELRTDINNTDDVLSNDKNFTPLGDTVFEWKIHNLKDHFIVGKPIVSPEFYSHPNGHLCHLYAEFEDEEVMGINLKVTGEGNNVESFCMDVLFEILKPDGTKIGYPSSNNIIIKDYALFFGDGIMRKKDVAKYTINNTCTIICTLSSHT